MGINQDTDTTWKAWIQFVREAFSCIDFSSDTKNWLFLPSKGGYYDQDGFFMTIWDYIRFELIQAFRDDDFVHALKKMREGK